jgi:hypothetical protein
MQARIEGFGVHWGIGTEMYSWYLGCWLREWVGDVQWLENMWLRVCRSGGCLVGGWSCVAQSLCCVRGLRERYASISVTGVTAPGVATGVTAPGVAAHGGARQWFDGRVHGWTCQLFDRVARV